MKTLKDNFSKRQGSRRLWTASAQTTVAVFTDLQNSVVVRTT